MKRINIFLLLGGLILSLYCKGCRNNLLPNPIGEEINPSSEENNQPLSLTVPQNVNATKGGKQKIVLSWTPVLKASKYYIYAASTQFDNFQKIGESTETEYTYLVNAGLTRYFQITAVNYLGEESEPSLIAMGATLACPYISSIVSNETENGVVTEISWYMDNVNYYLDGLNYTISVFNKGAIATSVTIVGSAEENGKLVPVTSYTFTDLPENSDLEFQVEAFLVSEQNDIESSDQTNAATAARQTPNAVTELEATQGTDKTNITLTFKTPDFVYIKSKNTTSVSNAYEAYPVYFKIFKKIHGTDSWAEIESHLYFNGSTEAPADTSTFFENYSSGLEVSWTDYTITRGIQYDYKVQSYVDNYNSVISSVKANAECTGWPMSIPEFKWTDFNYTFSGEDENKIKTAASLKFFCEWNNYGIEDQYKYIIQTDWTALNSSDTQSTYEFYNSISDICNKTVSFDPQSSIFGGEGKYIYTFSIVPKDTESAKEPSTVIERVFCLSKVFITKDISEPTWKGLAVESGYKDKILLKWEIESNEYSYKFTRSKSETQTSRSANDKTIVISPDIYLNGKDIGDVFTFEDKEEIESGVTYSYALEISANGVSHYYNGTLESTTLGTPEIIFNPDNLHYNYIDIKWGKVPEASTYSIKFNGTVIENESNEIIPSADGIISYQIKDSAIADYCKDATQSGKEINVEVTAHSDKDNASSTCNVFTLGPANTNIQTTVAASDSEIQISWTPVKGAKAYAIMRERCVWGEEKSIETIDNGSDSFLVKLAENNPLSSTTESVLFADGKFTYTDTFNAVTDDSDTTQVNQDKLFWGIPFKYSVFPLVSEEDKDSISGLYTNANQIAKLGSTRGLGLDIKASKSEYSDKIEIKWNQPYHGDKTPAPKILWKESDEADSSYSVLDASKYELGEDKTSAFIPLYGENRTKAFDFMVSYSSSSKPVFPDSFKKTLKGQIDKLTESLPKKETQNKGYAFAVNLSAGNSTRNNGFEEKFEWDLWDYNKRSLGPASDSKYLFQIKNNDYSSDWITVAEINTNGTITTPNNTSLNITTEETGLGLSSGLYIKPSAKENYGYPGILKTVRDFKHYGRIYATRTNSEDDTVEASYSDGSEDTTFAWRQITDEEWIRFTTLALTEGFWTACKGDNNWQSSDETTTYARENSTGGSITISRDRGTVTYSFSKWNPDSTALSGAKVSLPLCISNSSSTLKAEGSSVFIGMGHKEDRFTQSLAPTTITTEPESTILVSYPTLADSLKGTITLSSTGKDNLSISFSRNGQSETTLSISNRRYFLPIRYDGEDNWWHNNSNGTAYGWW